MASGPSGKRCSLLLATTDMLRRSGIECTGEIDHEVAEYWRENWDLNQSPGNNWDSVGPNLAGKLHVAVGDMDSYYLNNAMELMEEALANCHNPAPRELRIRPQETPLLDGYSPWRQGEDLSSAEFIRVVDRY